MKKKHKQKLVVLSIILFIMFNAPVMLMFNSEKAVFGMPVIQVYLFSVWLLTSALAFIIIRKFDE